MPSSVVAAGLLVYATIFGFELVDRTHFAVIGLAGRHGRGPVWLGAAAAFVVASAIAVAIGYLFVALLPGYLPWVKIAGGTVLVAFGVRGVLRAADAEEDVPAERRAALGRWTVPLTAFGTVLFLEMGDNTQILTIVFVGALRAPLLVFVAACLALVSVAAIGATGGGLLRRRVSPARLERALGWILIAVGAVTIALGALPLLGQPVPLAL